MNSLLILFNFLCKGGWIDGWMDGWMAAPWLRLHRRIGEAGLGSATMPSRMPINAVKVHKLASFAFRIGKKGRPAKLALLSKGVCNRLNNEKIVVLGTDGTDTTGGVIAVRIQNRSQKKLLEVIQEGGLHGPQGLRRQGVLQDERQVSSSIAQRCCMCLE